jgi:hypothetical protein
MSLSAFTSKTVAPALSSYLRTVCCLKLSEFCILCPVFSVGDDNCSATLVMLDDVKVYGNKSFQLGEEPE